MFRCDRRMWWLGLSLFLGGCVSIDGAREVWSELTHPVLVEGVVTAVAEPNSSEIQHILAQSEVSLGTTV